MLQLKRAEIQGSTQALAFWDPGGLRAGEARRPGCRGRGGKAAPLMMQPPALASALLPSRGRRAAAPALLAGAGRLPTHGGPSPALGTSVSQAKPGASSIPKRMNDFRLTRIPI